MSKYRKKPVEIEAMQFVGDFASYNKIKEFAKENIEIKGMGTTGPIALIIKTLEGDMLANTGDYIIKGVNGEFYPCKPDIFEKTYERVD
ncbi:hypothetical protein [Clostridium haemolyticum]|uniref:Phage protein n=1 Tax=Clostridium haemolyticum NCTC 9693 TaxID=1443114 RepID=A0ABR4TGV2_CLOHA|nr:hypothetical protein [Clostridium haemolyticum]KEI18254.1 hypothetical protein Z960_03810 [Clostridium haemolyticum NCTC 9693]KGN04177.1 hypothetical protein Z961_04300 [Clostridium haemolyticum NCTC 8350]